MTAEMWNNLGIRSDLLIIGSFIQRDLNIKQQCEVEYKSTKKLQASQHHTNSALQKTTICKHGRKKSAN